MVGFFFLDFIKEPPLPEHILEIYGSVRYCPEGALFMKKEKNDTKNPPFYSIPFLSVLYQNKALHNFRNRGQHSIVDPI